MGLSWRETGTMLTVAMEEDRICRREMVVDVFLQALKMLHLVALDGPKVVKATNNAVLAALHKGLIFHHHGLLVIEVKLRTKLVGVVAIRADGVVELNDFLKLVLTRLSGVSIDYLPDLDIPRLAGL
jgi:hypothetical protein